LKKAIEDLQVLAIRNGPRKKRAFDQSQKKPKLFKSTKEREYWRCGLPPIDQKHSLFLSADFVDETKRMNPQEVANILLSKEM